MEEENKSYGKSLFTPKNILIYVVVGAVIYAAVYFLFLSNKGSAPYQAPATQEVQEEITAENSITVAVGEENKSGESGTAVLVEEDGKTKVTVNLTGSPSGVPQPAHIHSGACPTPGAIAYPLTDVVDGVSETVLDVDLATLKAGLPLALNVHKSNEEIKTYVACGDLE